MIGALVGLMLPLTVPQLDERAQYKAEYLASQRAIAECYNKPTPQHDLLLQVLDSNIVGYYGYVNAAKDEQITIVGGKDGLAAEITPEIDCFYNIKDKTYEELTR